jgi:hypothetical protein
MRKLFMSFLAACVLALTGLATTAGATTITTVATGLDNPRGLTFLPNGTLAVGEAGHGGDVCVGGAVCVGATSQVSTINLANGTHTPIVTGLFSLELVAEGAVLGVGGLSTQGGRLLGIEGEFPQEVSDVSCTGQPSDCPQVLAAARGTAGTLGQVTPGKWRTIAGVGASDFQWTVDHQSEFPGSEEDSNPYGVLGQSGFSYVADAGSNLLDSVGANGTISVLFRFPDPVPAEPFPVDAVPTCVTRTPNGRLYVADLAGRIWRMTNGGTAATLVLPSTSGMHFTGCQADHAGNVYFVSIFSGTPFPSPMSGSLIKLSSTGAISTVVPNLNFPNKLAIGFDGSIYVSVNTVCPATPGPCGPATGSVVRITP